VIVAAQPFEAGIGWRQTFESFPVLRLQHPLDLLETPQIVEECEFSPDLSVSRPDHLMKLPVVPFYEAPHELQRLAIQIWQLVGAAKFLPIEPVQQFPVVVQLGIQMMAVL